jgi:putrescine aminotransferase
MKTDELKDVNGQHMLHPMVDPKAATEHPPLILEKADGVYVWDVDGRRYLDTVASLWNVNVGHNHPAIKRAITEQLDKLTYWSTFQNTTNPQPSSYRRG